MSKLRRCSIFISTDGDLDSTKRSLALWVAISVQLNISLTKSKEVYGLVLKHHLMEDLRNEGQLENHMKKYKVRKGGYTAKEDFIEKADNKDGAIYISGSGKYLTRNKNTPKQRPLSQKNQSVIKINFVYYVTVKNDYTGKVVKLSKTEESKYSTSKIRIMLLNINEHAINTNYPAHFSTTEIAELPYYIAYLKAENTTATSAIKFLVDTFPMTNFANKSDSMQRKTINEKWKNRSYYQRYHIKKLEKESILIIKHEGDCYSMRLSHKDASAFSEQDRNRRIIEVEVSETGTVKFKNVEKIMAEIKLMASTRKLLEKITITIPRRES